MNGKPLQRQQLAASAAVFFVLIQQTENLNFTDDGKYCIIAVL